MISYSCRKCKNQYNTNDRKPLELVCGHDICEKCFVEATNSSDNIFKCPLEENISFHKSQALRNSDRLLKVIEIRTSKSPVICSTHSTEEAKFYMSKSDIIGIQ